MVRVTKPGGRVLLIAYGDPAEFEALHVFISAARRWSPNSKDRRRTSRSLSSKSPTRTSFVSG